MSQRVEPKKVNRVAVSLAIGAGISVGAAPFLRLINHVEGWLVISILSLLAAAVISLFKHSTTYHKPNTGEYVLAAFDTTFIAALVGFFGMALYYLLFGIISGVEWLLVQLSIDLAWDQARWAYLVTIFVAVPVYTLVAAVYAYLAIRDLAPDTAGLRSPYYYMLTVDRHFLRTNLIWLLIYIVVLILGLFVWPKGWIPLVLLEVYFFFGTANFISSSIKKRIKEVSGPGPEKDYEKTHVKTAQAAVASIVAAGKKSEEQAQEERALKIVKDLYDAAGWQVEVAPRTTDPEVDPLLVDVDLLASRDDRGIIIDVISTPPGAPFADVRRPASITQAVWLLSDYRNLNPALVGASMVLVESPIDEKLVKVCRRLGINMILLDKSEIEAFQAISQEDSGQRSALAERLLRLPNPVVP